jgi:hypothetical protein
LALSSTQKELASQSRYLKIENEVLGSRLHNRITATEKERNKLVKFGSQHRKSNAGSDLAGC